MFATFTAKAEAAGAQVHHVNTRSQALAVLQRELIAEGVSDAPGCHAVWAPGTFLDGLDTTSLTTAVPGLRFEVTREAAASARAGISQLEWAVADTGTLAQDASAVSQRLVSTLPRVHLALVPARNLVPDLASLLEVLSPATAGYLALITGPSRTADIERVLTIGVHGPKRLVIIAVDEPFGQAGGTR